MSAWKACNHNETKQKYIPYFEGQLFNSLELQGRQANIVVLAIRSIPCH